jgi:NSS family neurotransmitter:Na+ symporter
MGILITYGSYLKKESDIEQNTTRVEWFDTGIAILAGLMIIPAVFAFTGGDIKTLKAGPSLMFITLPKVFDSMGLGNIIGNVFFLMVLFAALTSAISLFETCTATIAEELGFSRVVSSLIVLCVSLILGTASVFGYGIWSFVRIFGMQILDFFDFLTNSVMMPVSAFFVCILIIRVIGFDGVAKEVKLSSKFRRQPMYYIVTKYIAPFFLMIILASSIASALGFITI